MYVNLLKLTSKIKQKQKGNTCAKTKSYNKKSRRHCLPILFAGSAKYTSCMHIVGNAYATAVTEVKAPFVVENFPAVK